MNHAGGWVSRYGLGAVAAIALVLSGSPVAADGNFSEWPSAGQNIQNTRANLSEHRITPSNVGKLGVKWVFTTQGDVSATPSVDETSVYAVDFGGYVHRIDRTTGNAVWSRKVSDLVGTTYFNPFPFPINISRTTPALDRNRVIFGTQAGAWVIAVDRASGALLWKTQADRHPYAIVTTSPVVFGDLVYVGVASVEEGYVIIGGKGYACCTSRGSILALNKHTGAIVWKTYTLPEQSAAPEDRFAGAGVWGSTAAVDVLRGSLYVGTGNAVWAPDSVRLCIQAKNRSGDEDQDPTAKCTIAWERANHAHVYVDSVLSLDLYTGRIKWSRRLWGADVWNVACLHLPAYSDYWCPTPTGPDYDFAQGPALFTIPSKHGHRQLVGAGQKSGIYWALDPDDGSVVWGHQVGPGSVFGGLEWGSAVDQTRVYTALVNIGNRPYTLQPSGVSANAGGWAALDAATGKPVWQIADPAGILGYDLGPVSVANGVVFACSVDPVNGTMYALDAATGEILWSFSSGASCIGGASVVDGTVYWGTGYGKYVVLGFPFTPSNKLYAFEVKD